MSAATSAPNGPTIDVSDLPTVVFGKALMTALLYRGPVEKKHFEDIESKALFWAFVVLVWLPFALLFFLDGGIR